MRVDAVRMRMAVAAVRASAGDQLDAPAEIDDLRLVFDLCQQHGFEVDKPDIEDHAGFVQADELPGCRLEGFGARSRRYEYSDRTAEVIDDEVLKLVETAHTEAWTIINDNREILDELVRQLLVKETLNEKELAAIFAPIKKAPVRPVWLSNDRRPDSDKPPVEIPESLKRSVGMKPEE